CVVAIHIRAFAYPVVIDPAWTTTVSMATKRSHFTLTLVNSSQGQVAVAAGGTTTGTKGGITSDVELYDPGPGPGLPTWATTHPMKYPRAHHAAVVLTCPAYQGKVLVTGGQDPNIVDPIVNRDSAEIFDPDAADPNPMWIETPPMRNPRADHTA